MGKSVAGWVVEEGYKKGVRVAPWVLKNEKEVLLCSLVGLTRF